jgi:hypothetical protein
LVEVAVVEMFAVGDAAFLWKSRLQLISSAPLITMSNPLTPSSFVLLVMEFAELGSLNLILAQDLCLESDFKLSVLVDIVNG